MEIRIRENQMEEVEGIRPEFPYTFHQVEMKDTKIPWHWHEEVEFDWVERGEICLRLAGKNFRFKQGEGFFINSDVLCSMDGSGDALLRSHLFHPVLLAGHFHSVFETKFLEPVLHNRKIDVIELKGTDRSQTSILTLLKKAEKLWPVDPECLL